ncbi:MAG: hypothetical protein RIA08_03935 [Roseovarius sp.]|uniref:hypothetical protein n=1 Tax=Roseovarius sp. TaxID=1486281 RepID=UPI0032ED8965
MPLTHLTRALAVATLLSVTGGAALAAGTEPGTSVSSTVSISYSSGGTTITQDDAASVEFVVDRKVDFSFQGQDAGGTVLADQGAAEQVMVFRLENEGNDASGYDIDVARAGDIGLTHDPAGVASRGPTRSMSARNRISRRRMRSMTMTAPRRSATCRPTRCASSRS